MDPLQELGITLLLIPLALPLQALGGMALVLAVSLALALLATAVEYVIAAARWLARGRAGAAGRS